MNTRDNVINSIQDKDNATLYWIDALGVEYLSYFVELARQRGLAINIEIARADLPTITSINKGFFDNWATSKMKFSELDELKHETSGGFNFENCKTPIHLAKELDLLASIISRAASDLAMHKCKKVIIASDHGASRLAVIHCQEEKYETDTKGEHSGRCCKLFDHDLGNAIDENGYTVLADYGRFRGSRKSNLTKNEIGLTQKLIDKKSIHFYCIDCLADYLEVTTEELLDKIEEFKEEGCTLFK